MQRERDDDQPAPENLVGKLIKFAPYVAAAMGAGLATAYAVKEIKADACLNSPIDEQIFYQNLVKEKKERSHLGNIIRGLADGVIRINEINETTGFAPMHMACQTANITTVQALLSFRPNLAIKSACGNTPLELVKAIKAQKAEHKNELEVIEYILKVCDPHNPLTPPPWALEDPQFNCYKIAPPTFISFKPEGVSYVNGARVLCIDGGGTRGFVPIEFLDYIENWFPENRPDLGKRFKINEYFDWICGTSTGGLIALYLALGYSVADCRRMYFNLKDKIFTGSRPYNAKRFEDELKLAYGSERKMSDIQNIRCVVTTTTGSADHLIRVLISNYDPKTRDQFVWQAARCTSAAPYFFDPYQDPDSKIYYYDGGLTANNPTLAVLTEINRVARTTLTNGLVLSLGTGKPPESENLNLTVYKSPRSIATLVANLFKTLINQVSKSDGEVVEDAMTTCSHAKCFYYRMTPTLPESVLLDETDNEKLLNMIYHAKAYISMFKTEVNDVCIKLLQGLEKSGACVIT